MTSLRRSHLSTLESDVGVIHIGIRGKNEYPLHREQVYIGLGWHVVRRSESNGGWITFQSE